MATDREILARDTGAKHDTGLPLVEELRPAPEAVDVFRALTARTHCLFLDSARREPSLGRYSFVAADPFDYFELGAETPDAFDELSRRLAAFTAETMAGLPPFQGGAAGLFGYDLARQLERLPSPEWDEFHTPAMAIGLYDVVVALDHATARAWIISQGFPETEPARRQRRARQRLDQFRQWLRDAPADETLRHAQDGRAAISRQRLAPQFDVGTLPGLTSNFSRAGYLDAVQRAIEYIHAGDIFQVNLAQRLLMPASGDPVGTYLRLRAENPAPMAGFFNLGDVQLLSASPERFLQLRDGVVETRPIKGTRPRAPSPEADLFSGDELQASEKDRAENVMIVDLLRNDLSRACRPDSVRVTALCRLETYQYVQHLVSVVQGRLRDGCGPLDLLRATFPGGSITGAPKVRAMEIIAELEPTARGPYCGSLGYVGFDRSLDTSILIRTITAGGGWLQMPVGGGIVADSDPAREYAETWHKAEGLLRAFKP